MSEALGRKVLEQVGSNLRITWKLAGSKECCRDYAVYLF